MVWVDHFIQFEVHQNWQHPGDNDRFSATTAPGKHQPLIFVVFHPINYLVILWQVLVSGYSGIGGFKGCFEHFPALLFCAKGQGSWRALHVYFVRLEAGY
jgi:hypothetical protein